MLHWLIILNFAAIGGTVTFAGSYGLVGSNGHQINGGQTNY